MKRRARALVALLLVSIAAAQSPAFEPVGIECFMIMVGKHATADGSVLVAHNLELPGEAHPYVELIPGSRDRSLIAGRTVRVEHDAVVPGWMVLRTASSLASNAAGINAHGVALGGGVNLMEDRNARIRRADPTLATGVDGHARNAALLQSTTAREAAANLGAIYSEHGNAYACGVAYADADEIWYLESAGGSVWAAVRVPDDAYWPQGNSFRIGVIDPGDTANVMLSEGLLDFARGHDLWDPDEGSFSFRDAVGNGVEHRISERRTWRALAMLSPSLPLDPEADAHPMHARPGRPIALADLFALLRDGYDDGNPGNPDGRLARYPIGSRNVVHTDVVQLRSGMPVEVGAVLWTGMRWPNATVYVPLYLGIDAVPIAYATDVADRGFTRLRDSTYDLEQHERNAVLAELGSFERELVRGQRTADMRFLRRFADNPEEARRAMTAYAAEAGREAMERAEAVAVP